MVVRAYHTKLLQRMINETPKAVVGLILLSCIYIWIYKNFLPYFYLYLWIVLQSVFITLRFIHARLLDKAIKEKNSEKITQLTKQFFQLIVYSAFVWNFSIILGFIYAPPFYEFIGLIMVAGIVTAGVISLLPIFRTYMTYFLLMVIPQVFIFTTYNTDIHNGTLLLLSIYIPLIFLLSKSIYKHYLAEIKTNDNLEDSVDKLHHLSITDELTQVYNRRYFLESAQNLLAILQRENKPLSMLMLDIDFFKNINDSYGHQVGDFVLCELAKLLQSSLRKSDLLARIGGEEFAILLQNTSYEGAKTIAEKLRSSVSEHTFIIDSNRLKITISIGVATERELDMNFDYLYKNADTKLYEAKNLGRNQIC